MYLCQYTTQIAKLCGAILLTISLWNIMSPIACSQPILTITQIKPVSKLKQLAQDNSPIQIGIPLTVQEQTQISTSVLTRLQNNRITANQRFKVLRVTSTLSDKETTTEKRIGRVVVFNYSTGVAWRFEVDALSGQVLSEEPLRGRPQSSTQEVQEAIGIILANQELTRLLQTGSILEGGFIVDSPKGTSQINRYIQMQVLNRDRNRIQKLITVDLTRKVIASLFTPP